MYTIWYESSVRGQWGARQERKAHIETLDDFKAWFYGFYDNVFSYMNGTLEPFFINIDDPRCVPPRLTVRAMPYLGDRDYEVRMIKNEETGKIVFTDGEYTNNTCYINDEFRKIVEEIKDTLSHPSFEFE